MYPNLNAELARKGWTRKDLARETGLKYQTLNEKMNGKRPFTFPEAVLVKKALSTELGLEQVPDIAPVVAALDRFIITTLDNGYLEEVQCVSDLINARVTLVSTHQQMTSKERVLPVRKGGQPIYARRTK